MALKQTTKNRLIKAVANTSAGTEIASAIDANTAKVAAVVAPIATPASASAEDCANKINAVLTALKDAGLMASS